MIARGPSQLNSPPAAGFDEPFELLQACHERMQRMFRLLRRLRTHLAAMGNDAQARQAASDLMRYFDIAAPHHHEDEERHVFPRLLAAGQCVEAVQRLQREHREMTALWVKVRALLLPVAEGTWAGFGPEEEGTLEHFLALYDWHMVAENELVFPTCMACMDAQELAAMGREMAQRRGATGID
jgi:hemerythrin-like domain-containing protein